MRSMKWLGIVTVLGACAYGCSSTSVSPGAGVGPAESDGSVSGSDPDIFGAPQSGDDVSDAGPGTVTIDDAAASSDPGSVYSVTLTTSTFTVPANTEVYKCQDFANPFHGAAVDIHRYDLEMNSGSHHMLLFYTPGATDGPLIDCPQGGLQIGPYTFGAQSPKASQTYPDGVGAAIPAGMGFTVNAHYVNAGSTPIQGVVKVTMFVARPGVTTQHAGVLNFVLTSIAIPPTGQPYPVSGSCTIPQDVNVLWTGSHMHQRATHFVATSGATTLYQTTQWSEPPSQAFSPPLQLAANSNVDWTCTYVNDTGSPLDFGQSALTDAMCNFSATFYPVQDPSNPVVTCLK
jgi:hypothetical protein